MIAQQHQDTTNSATYRRANGSDAGGNGDSRSSSSDINNVNKSLFQKYLTNCKSLYSCIYCRTHLANHDELVSRSFQGNNGRAYLFNSVINVSCGPAEQRELNTGSHAVADISCGNCKKTLGWKYEKAYVETQKYKEGKYIIELAHVVRENRHLELDKGELFLSGGGGRRSSRHHRPPSISHQSSLTPPSLASHWSSPSSSLNEEVNGADDEDDVDDEELMFPFYDDICTSRSNYPSSLISSHHNRLRRSLYLDSTPYDWKFTTSSSAADSGSYNDTGSSNNANNNNPTQPLQPQDNRASSLESSDLSPSTSSSVSPDVSPTEQRQNKSYHIINSDNNKRSSYAGDNCNNRNTTTEHYGDREANEHEEEENDDDDETQFKFEADKPEISGQNIDAESSNRKYCDHKMGSDVGKNVNDPAQSLAKSIDLNSPSNDSDDDIDANELQKVSSPLSLSQTFNTSSNQRSSSVSLDDEEFYDCYTDHEVSGSTVSTPPYQ